MVYKHFGWWCHTCVYSADVLQENLISLERKVWMHWNRNLYSQCSNCWRYWKQYAVFVKRKLSTLFCCDYRCILAGSFWVWALYARWRMVQLRHSCRVCFPQIARMADTNRYCYPYHINRWAMILIRFNLFSFRCLVMAKTRPVILSFQLYPDTNQICQICLVFKRSPKSKVVIWPLWGWGCVGTAFQKSRTVIRIGLEL